ncbi:hypothetical protein ILUMI_08390 [Ignelater luminosus]|uniref:acylphosphatase n=1 Tax=Ignelater luminosus TaxID=2038154 RepID=A0A8K0D1R9_IGNLU|nr:hypothetical protein ILUMI_08390 [Ignelater luminosus]
MGGVIVPIVSVEFEVFGKVQGVYFTKHCREYAEQLGVTGWVKNSKKGTILGMVQGFKPNVEALITWLSNKGSPGCQIEHCDLTNWQTLARPEYRGFSIRF